MATTEYVTRIIAAIKSDIEAGLVPGTVSSFAELHDYVDANSYTDAVLPEEDAFDYDLINAVEDEVSRRLAIGEVA